MSGIYRILYVDDEPDLLDIAKIFLEKSEDFSVVTIDSAPAALNLLKVEQFDAIISDYQMPEIDGIEFLKQVRNSGNIVPFIIFTGKGREEIVIRAFNEGADFYIQKGGEPKSQFVELAHKVRQAVSVKRAGAVLKESESYLKSIIRVAPIGIGISKDRIIQSYNDRFSQITGYVAEELIGKPARILYQTQEDYDYVGREIFDKIPLEGDRSIETRWKKKTGTIIDVFFTGASIDPSDISAGVIFTALDITERKRAEEQLKLTEWRQRLSLEIGQIGTFEVDLDSGKGIWSGELAKIWGIPDNFTGNFVEYCWNHTHPDDLLRVRAEFAVMAESHTITDMEFRIITPDSEVRWIIWKGVVNSDSRTGKMMAAGVNMDITGRKQAEEKLRNDEKYFRAIFETSADLIHVLDKSGVITSTNTVNLAITGYSEQDLLGKSIRDFFTPVSQELFDKNFPVLMEKGMNRVEVEFVCKNGHILIFDCSASIVRDSNGAIQYFVVFQRDITKRKRAEEEVKTKIKELDAAYEKLSISEAVLRQNYKVMESSHHALQESEEKFRTVVEFTYDWEYWISPAGEILYSSPSCEKISGYTVKELTADPTLLERMVHEDDRLVYSTHNSRITSEQDSLYQEEFRIHTKDGLERWIGHVCNPVYGTDGTYRGRRACNRDITDRKQAQEELKESEELYRLLADNSTDVIWLLGLDGSFTYISPSIFQLRGYTQEEVMHQSHEEVISKGSLSKVQEMIQKTLEDAKSGIETPPTAVEVEQPCKDGTSVWTEVISHLLYDASGKPEGFIGVSRNITERKKAEELIETNRRLLQVVIDNSQYLIYAKDLEGRFIMVSQSLASLFGYPREQIMGKTSHDFLPKEIADQHRVNDLEVMAHKSPINIEEIAETADGIRTYFSTKFPLSDTEGNIYAVCGASIDITERKQREEELKIKDFAIESSINAIGFTDLQGNLTYVNPAFFSIMGYENPQEVLNKSVLSFWTSSDDIQKVFEGLKKQGSWSGEITGKRKNGTTIQVQVSINRIHDASGKPVAMMGSFVDITERIQAQEAVWKINQKLHVLSRLTREDLNNKILALSSYLDLARIQLKKQEPVTVILQKLDAVVEQISRINEYTKDYQDMGVKPPKWQNLKNVMLLGLSHITLGNIQHSFETGNLEIFADPLLEKVCQQFFENSLMHGEHVTRIRVWHTITPGKVTIFFEDDGIGIPQEKKEKIFLRDISSRSSRNSLIFAKEILDITGMSLRETGEPGKGARFEINVPVGASRFGE